MHPYVVGWFGIKSFLTAFIAVAVMELPAEAGLRAVLQGQSRSSTNWIANNLKEWREMDAVPCRVHLTGGPVNNQQLIIHFDHFQGGKPAIDDLVGFAGSSNVVITSAPILSAPARSAVWSYILKVRLLDRQPGHLTFYARLAAGAHRNVGSSVALRGTPAMGTLQIHKPGPGAPDLTVTKRGASNAIPGEVITYTLDYSNKAGSAAAECVEIIDTLPSQASVVPGSIKNGGLAFGNLVVWNLGTLAAGASGKVSFDVRVKAAAPCNVLFTNTAVITSKGDRHKPKDDDDDGGHDDDDDGGHDDDDDGDKDNYTKSSGSSSDDDDDDGGEHDDDDNGGDDDDDCHDKHCNKGDKCGSRPDSNFNDNVARFVTRTICNSIPVAVDDAYSTIRDRLLQVQAPGILANDSDADGDRLAASLIAGPSHGVLNLSADGSFSYQPAAGFVGADSFVYAATDGKSSSTATVTIVVEAMLRPPLAANDSFQTKRDTTLVIPAPGVLANDTDPDGDALTAALVNGPAHGTLVLNANGAFQYNPASGFAGADSFTYAASDGIYSSAATVTIMVQAENRPPSAAPDSYNASRNASLSIGSPGVLANDMDMDGDSLTAFINTPPAHGSVALSANGSFIYAPATDFVGTDTFTYVARDSTAQSAPATVTIIVSGGTNLPPQVTIAIPTNGSVFIAGMDFLLCAEASDPDGQVTSVELFEGANSLGIFTELPYALRFTNVTEGEFQFTALATDNDGATAISEPVTVTVLASLPFSAGPFRLNRQTGLFEQTVTITNPTPQPLSGGVRLRIGGLRPRVGVWNRTGIIQGIPYIDRTAQIPSGATVEILVTYYTPDIRVAPAPVYMPEILPLPAN